MDNPASVLVLLMLFVLMPDRDGSTSHAAAQNCESHTNISGTDDWAPLSTAGTSTTKHVYLLPHPGFKGVSISVVLEGSGGDPSHAAWFPLGEGATCSLDTSNKTKWLLLILNATVQDQGRNKDILFSLRSGKCNDVCYINTNLNSIPKITKLEIHGYGSSGWRTERPSSSKCIATLVSERWQTKTKCKEPPVKQKKSEKSKATSKLVWLVAPVLVLALVAVAVVVVVVRERRSTMTTTDIAGMIMDNTGPVRVADDTQNDLYEPLEKFQQDTQSDLYESLENVQPRK